MAPSGDAPGLLRQVVQEAQGDTKVGMAVSPPGLPTEQEPQQSSPTCLGVGGEKGDKISSLCTSYILCPALQFPIISSPSRLAIGD